MLRRVFTVVSRNNRTSMILQRQLSSGNEDKLNNKHIPIIDRDDPEFLPLPQYPRKVNESLQKKKSRLIYQSRKRGMLENDLLLSTFAAKYLASMDEKQTDQYDHLINGPSNDWDIYNWAIGAKPTPEEYDSPIMNMLKEHVSNPNREKRLRMPNL